jgi:four helix bundle protein
MRHLDHEKLDVYQASIDMVVLIDGLVENLPKGRGYLCDQFQRAALSVSLNIAEGAGEFSCSEKSRFYRMAKRSATECAGIFDVCYRLNLIKEEQYRTGRDLILRIVLC